MECLCNRKLNHMLLIGLRLGGRQNPEGPQGDFSFRLGKWKEADLVTGGDGAGREVSVHFPLR